MNRATLIGRSLRFYWRTHLGVVAGAVVASAVLVGALVVGDSVRHSLRTFALLRLGRVRVAIASGDRFFRARLAAEVGEQQDAPTAAALQTRGVAARGDGTARANQVQVLGVTGEFWDLGGADDPLAGSEGDRVVLNERLANHLDVEPGDMVLLRVAKPSLLPRDAPLSSDADTAAAFRLTVQAVASDEQFGRFSLRASQIPPYNAFVPLSWLQEQVGLAGRANLLLVGGEVAAERLQGELPWRLADAGLEVRRVELPEPTEEELQLHAPPPAAAFELRSDRVFIDPPVADAARRAATAEGVLAYFVNELRVGERSTPYSIVAGGGLRRSRWRFRLGEDEIAINQWLADDLEAEKGDTLRMTYFVLGPMRSLKEQSASFRVVAIAPMDAVEAYRTLMPEFPGVSGAENCRDWEPGIPIDLGKIRDKDEAYWDRYRGTPKAFVSLAAAQRMWANRFGRLTALRFPLDAGPKETLAGAIREELDPASVGLFFRPVREQALAASTEALDFGQLFIGLSFFLIAAAVLLMGLLFAFGVEQRAAEVGTLLAVGYRPRQVQRLLLVEGGALAAVGGVVGAACGMLYTRVVLWALTTVWSGAVADTQVLHFHANPTTVVVGAAASVAVALAAMWVVLRRQGRRPARELLVGEVGGGAARAGRSRLALGLGIVTVVAAVALVAWAGASQDRRAAAAFFGAGGLLLVGGLSLSRVLLGGLGRAVASRLTLGGLGARNTARRRGRSLAVVGLLACGCFLVVAVAANRRDPTADAQRRDSGTGGFAFLGRTAVPVFEDLNAEAGRDAFGLEAKEMEGVGVVHLRVREGDDASCLNLNRAQSPRLLGVRPGTLASRGAFAVSQTTEHDPEASPWTLLERDEGDDVVPCIGDEPTVVWGLGKSLGDTIPYTDERGRPFQLRLVGVLTNSVLQGSLLISEEHFEKRFPSEAGYRMFLIDVPEERREAVSQALSRALTDVGLELTPTEQRLADLMTVQNTYLSIFQALGGLGLLLGSVGLGIVVLRNVLERRSELALLRAVGFRRRSLEWLVLAEHWLLVVLGVGCGVVAALVAVVPALRSPGASMPVVSLPLTLAAIAVSALAWTWLASAWALRSPLLSALRNE
ncbi:MAG: FtsX-like permease family protein [bacterium]